MGRQIAQNKRSKANQGTPVWRRTIHEIQQAYQKVATEKGLDYQQEQVFAVQACMNNEKLKDTATNNPDSLRLALLNSAAIGISLNPADKLAYLVPRDGQVVLDISYRGLIKIAVDIGSIKMASAELVYSNDHFKSLGPWRFPDHVFDPFAELSERGEFRGAYCAAKLVDGSELVTFMRASEIYKAREKSLLYKYGKGPWIEWPEEMMIKTVIKRASKMWPHSGGRLAKAIHLLNEQGEGLPSIENHAEQEEIQPDHSKVSEAWKTKTEELVNRAIKAQAWSAAKQYIHDRASNIHECDYAEQKLREAENNRQPQQIEQQTTSSEQQQQPETEVQYAEAQEA